MKGYSKINSSRNHNPPELFPSQPTNPKKGNPPAEMQKADASDEEPPQLRRNVSVSNMPRHGTSMNRIISVRRSTSVSDSYSRIRDQNEALRVGWDEGAEGTDSCSVGSATKEKKVGRGGNRLLKACKRIFRF